MDQADDDKRTLRKDALDRALLLNAATFDKVDAAKIVENARLFEAYMSD